MTYTMRPVYKKLSKIGLKKKQVQTYLPDWWEDSVATTEAGFQQSLWLISNTFHLDFKSLERSLEDKDSKPLYRLPHHLFKHSINLDKEHLKPAVSVAMLAAKLTLSALNTSLADLSNLSANKIRKEILDDGNEWVNFESLVKYCWDIGIPVIFVKSMPTPKMDGLALMKNERPMIILTKNSKHGVLLFHLAHELGHIILGHVDENGMMIDKKISEGESIDACEVQANKFALELLTGKIDTKVSLTRGCSPSQLAQLAISNAQSAHIDPLHIILNYGYSNDNFAFANMCIPEVVRKLGIKETDQQIALEYFLKNIDVDSIIDDEVLRRIIGAK